MVYVEMRVAVLNLVATHAPPSKPRPNLSRNATLRQPRVTAVAYGVKSAFFDVTRFLVMLPPLLRNNAEDSLAAIVEDVHLMSVNSLTPTLQDV
jgi:hypothetical protein